MRWRGGVRGWGTTYGVGGGRWVEGEGESGGEKGEEGEKERKKER